MKQFIKWLVKAFAAGCIAFAALSLFAFFYYNVPVHYDNPSGATEYVWECHKFYSKGTEGFALGRTNNEGFNNLLDRHKGDSIDILLMGSSHMEGFNVAQDENAAAVINRLFDGEKYCYNIGTAGHSLMYCIKNLPDALAEYEPEGYVVLETFSIDFSRQELKELAEGTLADIPSRSGGFIGLMQKIPYIRLFYTQHFKGGDNAFGDIESSEPAGEESFDYAAALSPVLDIVADSCEAWGVKPVIVYNMSLFIDPDEGVHVQTDMDKLEIFSSVCEEKGISFVCMKDTFLAEFQRSARLPYGFSNTSPGGGHMNALGHELFAEEVVRTIREMEG